MSSNKKNNFFCQFIKKMFFCKVELKERNIITAIDRKKLSAVLFARVFAVFNLIYVTVDFI